MGDENSLQICFPLLLISAYTVNKKHDSRLIRATCYLLTRWHNLVRMLFNLKLKKKKKKEKARLSIKSLIKHAKRKSTAHCYLKTASCKSQQNKLLSMLSQLQNFSKKTITLPVSADTSTNSGNLAVVFWNILLE